MTTCPYCGEPTHPFALVNPLKLDSYFCENCRLFWTFGEEQHRLRHHPWPWKEQD